MPNITVKKFDGVTDILYTQTQLGGSDAARPAVWQSKSVGSAASHRPEFRYYVRRGSDGRNEVVITGHYPILSTDSTTGITSIIGRHRMKTVWEIDNRYNQVDVNEFVAQAISFQAASPSTGMRSFILDQSNVSA